MKTYLRSFVAFAVLVGAAGLVLPVMADNPSQGAYYAPDATTTSSFSPANTVQTDNAFTQSTDAAKANDAATAKATEDAKKAKEACDAATGAAKSNPSTTNLKAVSDNCKASNYATNTPQGSGARTQTAAADTTMADYKALGDGHAMMMNPDMNATIAAKGAPVKMLAVNTTAPENLSFSNNTGNSARMSTDNIGGLSSVNSPDAVKVTSVKLGTNGTLDEGQLRAKYDPANVVVGGTGSGMIRCNGGSGCPGGKYGVDKNDGSYVTTLASARNERFENWDLPQTKTDTLNSGYLVDDTMKKVGATSSKLQVASMIQSMGEANGMDQKAIDIAIGTANRESSFRTNVGPATTSAYGYGQYVGDTWIGAAKDANGNVLNRNNSFNQAEVLLNDTQDRYETYQNSPKLQAYFGDKGGAGAYDYTIHYAGSMSASQDRINYAINYYNRTNGVGSAYAQYAANGGSSDGVVIGGGENISGFGGTGGGSGGSGGVNGFVQQMMSGLGGSGSPSQMAQNAIMQALGGQNGGSQQSSGTNSNNGQQTGSNGTTTDGTTKTAMEPLTGYQLLKAQEILKSCGEELPTTDDAVMLKVARCQALGKIPPVIVADAAADVTPTDTTTDETTDDTVTQ